MARRRITITRSGGRRSVHRGRSRSPKNPRRGIGIFPNFFVRWFNGGNSSQSKRRRLF